VWGEPFRPAPRFSGKAIERMIRPILVGVCCFISASLLAQPEPARLQSLDRCLEITVNVTERD